MLMVLLRPAMVLLLLVPLAQRLPGAADVHRLAEVMRRLKVLPILAGVLGLAVGVPRRPRHLVGLLMASVVLRLVGVLRLVVVVGDLRLLVAGLLRSGVDRLVVGLRLKA